MWIFKPILKQVVWGGEKIKRLKKLEHESTSIGESWEVSGLPGHESVVAEGPDEGLSLPELIEKYGPELLGEKNYLKYGSNFPLLIKFIDARRDLSVQVHPDDELAQSKGYPFGKTEMWLILEADPDSRIAYGFNKRISPEDYTEKVCSPDIISHLNYHPIKKGDSFLIPAGRIHAIGAGTLLVEIQQSSDITYRLYDYERKDANGNLRELHHEDAYEAINFEDVNPQPISYKPHEGTPVNLVTDSRFTVNLLKLTDPLMRDYSEWDTFVVLTVLEGGAELTSGSHTKRISKGETVLLPASCHHLHINPDNGFEALETFIK